MHDDGVGVRSLDVLKEMDLGENVELVDGGTSTFDALARYRGGKKLIVID